MTPPLTPPPLPPGGLAIKKSETETDAPPTNRDAVRANSVSSGRRSSSERTVEGLIEYAVPVCLPELPMLRKQRCSLCAVEAGNPVVLAMAKFAPLRA
jgi:hypothetical protein